MLQKYTMPLSGLIPIVAHAPVTCLIHIISLEIAQDDIKSDLPYNEHH
jgi:hypothetical protein